MKKIDYSVLNKVFREELEKVDNINVLNQLEKKYLGKNSEVKKGFEILKNLPNDEKQNFAKEINSFKLNIQAAIDQKKQELQTSTINDQLKSEWLDITLPGTVVKRGALHPITQIELECMEVLRKLGFELIDGFEVETSFYNFDALNIPEHHPAREMQDTFWLKNNCVLRSHTTCVQARTLEEKRSFPIKIASAGRVYRNEAVDATHVAMFHQLEGFWIDYDLTFADLKGLISYIAKELYGQDRKLRIKPKYYPYTEPSIGMDVQCTSCKGAGCTACHHVGWVTIIGAGMIHRKVLEAFGYNADEVTGLAFGWGTTRMAAQKYGVKKTKEFYDQDLRFYELMNRR